MAFSRGGCALGPEPQGAEGQKIDEAALEACRHWQERAEVFLVPGGAVLPITGRSLESIGGNHQADPWELKSRRRFSLINKKFHSPEGLCAAEAEELRWLQADFESYLDSIRPLPNQVLAELEALAEQLEAEDERS